MQSYNDLQTLRLFSRLFPNIYPYNDWGDLENDASDMDADELLQYADKIQELIQNTRLSREDEHGLAIYIHDEALGRKVFSIYPSVEEHNGELWGVTEVKTYGALSAAEYAELTEFLTGQYADGWGEGFEQKSIPIPEGELCISFWDSSDQFFIKPEDELDSPSFSFHISM